MANITMPKPFADKKGLDLKATLTNLLNTQLERDRIPLYYVVRDDDAPIVRVNANFHDDYVNQCSLQSREFSLDTAKVQSYILNLI